MAFCLVCLSSPGTPQYLLPRHHHISSSFNSFSLVFPLHTSLHLLSLHLILRSSPSCPERPVGPGLGQLHPYYPFCGSQNVPSATLLRLSLIIYIVFSCCSDFYSLLHCRVNRVLIKHSFYEMIPLL